jgi:hypothetical protein
MTRLILTFLLIAGCEPKVKPADPKPDRFALLQATFDERLAATDFGETGWPNMEDCDGLLWSGLAAAAGVSVDLTLAEYEPGEWHRRPPPACWDGEDRGSKSTISNDMIVGLLWGLWRQRDKASLTRLADYAAEHDFVIGEPFPEMASRVIMKPNVAMLLARSLFSATHGQYDRVWRRFPPTYLPVEKDYERHIQALSIALLGEINESLARQSLDATYSQNLLDVNQALLTRVQALADAEPQNPLYQAILGIYSGDFSTAIDLLLDDQTPIPTYVRGKDQQAYAVAQWLFVARLVLRRAP